MRKTGKSLEKSLQWHLLFGVSPLCVLRRPYSSLGLTFLHWFKWEMFHVAVSLQRRGISAGGIPHICQVLMGDMVNAGQTTGLQGRTPTYHL